MSKGSSQKVHDPHTKYQLRARVQSSSSQAKKSAPRNQPSAKPSAATKALNARVSDPSRIQASKETVVENLEDSEQSESDSSYEVVMHTTHLPPLKQGTSDIMEPDAKCQQRVAFSSDTFIFSPPPSNVDTPNQILQRITAFNPLWATFYTAQIEALSLKPHNVYCVLVLVSTVGCPQVLTNILNLLQNLQVASKLANYTMAAITLYNYRHADIVQGQLRKRYALTYLYACFEFLCTSIQGEIQQKRTLRWRLACNQSPTTSSSASKVKGSSHVLD